MRNLQQFPPALKRGWESPRKSRPGLETPKEKGGNNSCRGDKAGIKHGRLSPGRASLSNSSLYCPKRGEEGRLTAARSATRRDA